MHIVGSTRPIDPSTDIALLCHLCDSQLYVSRTVWLIAQQARAGDEIKGMCITCLIGLQGIHFQDRPRHVLH